MSARYQKFSKLGFDDFRKMASDESLSRYEKIGFPDEYREGRERSIFDDIRRKIPALDVRSKVILDIGPGCSDLAHYLIDHSDAKGQQLILVDSEEMLRLLPESPAIRKEAAYYPNCPALLEELAGRIDVIICYSVFHYIFEESNTWDFLDRSLALLAPGGRFLIGDIPNVSKRKRFFASETGIHFHKTFMQTDDDPVVTFNRIEPDTIDDSVMMAVVMRARLAGYDAYVVPQADDLPMANRREDILIIRP